MKKTKTGLYIETKGKTIDVYTEEEVQQMAIKARKRYINLIILCIVFWTVALSMLMFL